MAELRCIKGTKHLLPLKRVRFLPAPLEDTREPSYRQGKRLRIKPAPLRNVAVESACTRRDRDSVRGTVENSAG